MSETLHSNREWRVCINETIIKWKAKSYGDLKIKYIKKSPNLLKMTKKGSFLRVFWLLLFIECL